MQNVQGQHKWIIQLVGLGIFEKVVQDRGLDCGHTQYFQGQLRELRGTKDQGGALEKGDIGRQAPGCPG